MPIQGKLNDVFIKATGHRNLILNEWIENNFSRGVCINKGCISIYAGAAI